MLAAVIPFAVVIGTIGALFSSFGSMKHLPAGAYLASYPSPSGREQVNLYLCGGNATTDFSIRGELETMEDDSIRNIYWRYHEESADVVWESDGVVSINGHRMDLSANQCYDWRKEP